MMLSFGRVVGGVGGGGLVRLGERLCLFRRRRGRSVSPRGHPLVDGVQALRLRERRDFVVGREPLQRCATDISSPSFTLTLTLPHPTLRPPPASHSQPGLRLLAYRFSVMFCRQTRRRAEVIPWGSVL